MNPPLQISEAPKEAKSLALIVEDPDAPGSTFVHWLMWNIDPKTTTIKENKLPAGALQGRNGWDNNSYGGPCPPSGSHRYYFRIYVLDIQLDLTPSSQKTDLEKAMQGHVLDQTELMATYQR